MRAMREGETSYRKYDEDELHDQALYSSLIGGIHNIFGAAAMIALSEVSIFFLLSQLGPV